MSFYHQAKRLPDRFRLVLGVKGGTVTYFWFAAH